MTGKVENVRGGGEGMMEKFLLSYFPFCRTGVGLKGATLVVAGLKSLWKCSMELQCELTFSHTTCLLNEQHAAPLLHRWPGNQWSEDIPEHAKPYFQRLGLHVWQPCCSGSQKNFSLAHKIDFPSPRETGLHFTPSESGNVLWSCFVGQNCDCSPHESVLFLFSSMVVTHGDVLFGKGAKGGGMTVQQTTQ